MSSILTSQIEAPKLSKKVVSALQEIAAIVTMFAVTATGILLTSLSWVA